MLPPSIVGIHLRNRNKVLSIVDANKSRAEADAWSTNGPPDRDSGVNFPGDGRNKIVDPGYQFNPKPPTQKFEELPQVVGNAYQIQRLIDAAQPVVGGIIDVGSSLYRVGTYSEIARHFDHLGAIHVGYHSNGFNYYGAANAIRAEALWNVAGAVGAEYLKHQADKYLFENSNGPGMATWLTDVVVPLATWNVITATRVPPQYRIAASLAKPLIVAGAHVLARYYDG
jgi:hypothetical protein